MNKPKPAPVLCLILVWNNLAGYLAYATVRRLLQYGIPSAWLADARKSRSND